MENLWTELPEKNPYILEQDKSALDYAESHSRKKGRTEFHFELLPEPFLGRPDAPVVLLNLNPGYNEYDIDYHTDAEFIALSRANLHHHPLEYPFYLLDPRVAGAPGASWWLTRQHPTIKVAPRLKQLVADAGLKTVAQGILCVEFFPYHSLNWTGSVRVPSQKYSFSLVREAIKSGAAIVQMRSQREWLEAVPELRNYKNYFKLKNPQNTTITPGNCPEGNYELLVNTLLRG